MINNVIPLFKENKKDTRALARALSHKLNNDFVKLESFDDYTEMLCALGLIVSDVCVQCADGTGKGIKPEVFCDGLLSLIKNAYESRGYYAAGDEE